MLYSGDVGNKLTDEEVNTTLGFSAFVSAASLLGSIFIIVCYIAFKHLRKFSFTLVMLLSVTDVLNQAFDFVAPRLVYGVK